MNRPTRIPADIDRPDRILAGLTARQLGLLAVPGVLLWLAYLLTRNLVPLPVFAGLGLPVAGAALALALSRRDGLGLDELAVAAWQWRRGPRHLVSAPEGVAPPPAWTGHGRDPLPGPLQPPRPSGLEPVGTDVPEAGEVVDLGEEGAAVLAEVTSPNFSLRSAEEQAAMVATFARFANSLDGPIQVLVRAEPLDLDETLAQLRAAAGGLPHPGLEAAALGHARFLGDLAARHDLLRRRTLLVLRDDRTAEARGVLARRLESAVAGLAPAGVSLRPISADEARRVLAASSESDWAYDPTDRVITAEADL